MTFVVRPLLRAGIHVENHPDYQTLLASGDEEPTVTLMEELWTQLADGKVLVSPGTYVRPSSFTFPASSTLAS